MWGRRKRQSQEPSYKSHKDNNGSRQSDRVRMINQSPTIRIVKARIFSMSARRQDQTMLIIGLVDEDVAQQIVELLDMKNITEIAVTYNPEGQQLIVIIPLDENPITGQTYEVRVTTALIDVLYHMGFVASVKNYMS